MKCPKCGMEFSKKGYCMHCGYLENGNIIDTKKPLHASLLELYFGKAYDKYTRNKNWLISFIIGPVYIFSNGFYIAGLGLIILDFLISISVLLFNQALLITATIWFLNSMYWLFNRILWATINNMILIKLTAKKIKKYQDKNLDNYELTIQDLYKKEHRFTVIKYIAYSLLFFILFSFIKPYIINFFMSL